MSSAGGGGPKFCRVSPLCVAPDRDFMYFICVLPHGHYIMGAVGPDYSLITGNPPENVKIIKLEDTPA